MCPGTVHPDHPSWGQRAPDVLREPFELSRERHRFGEGSPRRSWDLAEPVLSPLLEEQPLEARFDAGFIDVIHDIRKAGISSKR